jgi:hypothetical protein
MMEEIKTEEMLNDPNIHDLLNGKKPIRTLPGIDIFQLAESFLYLFEEREDYELCHKLVTNWPQLKNENHG